MGPETRIGPEVAEVCCIASSCTPPGATHRVIWVDVWVVWGGQIGVGEVSLSAFRFTAYWLWGLKGRHDYGLFRFWELGLYKTRP